MKENKDTPIEVQIIEAARKKKIPTLTKKDAAIKAGISPNRWHQLIDGFRRSNNRVSPTRPSRTTLLKMAIAVDLDPRELEKIGKTAEAKLLQNIYTEMENKGESRLESIDYPIVKKENKKLISKIIANNEAYIAVLENQQLTLDYLQNRLREQNLLLRRYIL